MTENPDRFHAYAPNIRKRQLEKFRCRYCNKWHDYPVKMETGKYDNPVLPVLEDNQPIELRLCIRTYRYIASAEYVGSPLQQEVESVIREHQAEMGQFNNFSLCHVMIAPDRLCFKKARLTKTGRIGKNSYCEDHYRKLVLRPGYVKKSRRERERRKGNIPSTSP